MRNFLQTGEILPLVVPAGGVLSGQGLIVGSIFGVAITTEVAGARVEANLTGVFNFPAKSGDVFALGDKVYFVSADKTVTVTAGSNKLIGVATGPVAGGVAPVRLNGVALA